MVRTLAFGESVLESDARVAPGAVHITAKPLTASLHVDRPVRCLTSARRGVARGIGRAQNDFADATQTPAPDRMLGCGSSTPILTACPPKALTLFVILPRSSARLVMVRVGTPVDATVAVSVRSSGTDGCSRVQAAVGHGSSTGSSTMPR